MLTKQITDTDTEEVKYTEDVNYKELIKSIDSALSCIDKMYNNIEEIEVENCTYKDSNTARFKNIANYNKHLNAPKNQYTKYIELIKKYNNTLKNNIGNKLYIENIGDDQGYDEIGGDYCLRRILKDGSPLKGLSLPSKEKDILEYKTNIQTSLADKKEKLTNLKNNLESNIYKRTRENLRSLEETELHNNKLERDKKKQDIIEKLQEKINKFINNNPAIIFEAYNEVRIYSKTNYLYNEKKLFITVVNEKYKETRGDSADDFITFEENQMKNIFLESLYDELVSKHTIYYNMRNDGKMQKSCESYIQGNIKDITYTISQDKTSSKKSKLLQSIFSNNV